MSKLNKTRVRSHCVGHTLGNPVAVLLTPMLLMLSCAQGTSDRPEPESVEFKEVGELYEEPELVDPENLIVESASNMLAKEHAPTEEGIDEIPEDLECEGNPGSKVLHRLNRLEYNNTIRDLLGDDTRPADTFPKDDFGDSFDNNARALTVSPLLAEAYVDSAAALAAAFMADGSKRNELMVCRPGAVGAKKCTREILTGFLNRAFRRPVYDDEVTPYVDVALAARDQGSDFEESIQGAIEAALLSVNFLFRVERDVEPEKDGFHRLTDYELANRLSYYLWSSMPDDALFEAARTGQLRSMRGIQDQVERMLDDDRADTLLDAFIGRWLEIDDIAESNQPAGELFPEYTDELKAAMEAETRALMRDVLKGDLHYKELFTANYTYLNQLLADHYEIEGEFGEALKKTSTEDTIRLGLLTQGSILTLTGAPTRTSPVRRGVYVLSNLLCSPPPAPPPSVQADLDLVTDEIPADLPLAERLKRHSSDPSCAACHRLMDPIGLGLENFDAIGRYRSEDQGQEIQAEGVLLLNGEEVEFSGAEALARLLSDDERLARCATKKLYSFALGRLPSDTSEGDRCRLDLLAKSFKEQDYDFRKLITLMALTDSFRGRHGGLEPNGEDN